MTRGSVVVCDVVVSEVVAGLASAASSTTFSKAPASASLPTEVRSAIRAGEMQRRYKDRLKADGRKPVSRRARFPIS